MSESPKQERRKAGRLILSYYLPVTDSSTEKVMGHLVDISPQGLMIDSKEPLPTDLDFNLRLELMEDVAEKAFVEFSARIRWCRSDPVQPFMYNAGLEIVDISPEDSQIVQRIAERYGRHQAPTPPED